MGREANQKRGDLMKSLSDSSLYLLTPADIIDPDVLIPMVILAVRSGADIIQFRNKMASATTRDMIRLGSRLCDAVHMEGALFIVNDRIDVAIATGADGVHLGQDDLPVDLARHIVSRKNKMLIGISTHSPKQAMQAESEGADYIGFGPIYPTSAKSDYSGIGTGFFPLLNENLGTPYFAIGGINLENIGQVLEAGASRVAICSGIFGPKKDVAQNTQLIKKQLLSRHQAG